MKKNTFKKVIVPVALVAVIASSSAVAIWSAKKNDNLAPENTDVNATVSSTEANLENTTAVPETETELVTKMVTEVVTKKNADGKVVTSVKETPTVVEVVTKKVVAPATTVKSVSGTTAKTTTTKKQTTTTTTKPANKPTTTTTKSASKPTTTKKPVATTQKPKPTTTKPKDEYYPSLTAADMEEVKQYAINYIKQRGYKVEPQITWTNSTWGSVVGTDDDLSKYGDRYKKNGGINPKTEAKNLIKIMADTAIRNAEDANDGTGEVYGIYPLVRHAEGGWQWAVGTW